MADSKRVVFWLTSMKCRKRYILSMFQHRQAVIYYSAGTKTVDKQADFRDDEFTPLDLGIKTDTRKKYKRVRLPIRPPRYTQMPIDQDWTDVWPTPRVFNPSVIPLPIHQGYVTNKSPPGKFANAELLKIPNFFHLTPPHIKKHCEAIKKFCTRWPEGLETDEKCDRHFPLEVITSDYCHSGPVIRDPRARTVKLKIRASSLQLDSHARDKLLRIVEDRYDKATDILTLTSERCPLKKQNYDYAVYLLTALYHESWKCEAWESEKVRADMELYEWEDSQSKSNIMQILNTINVDHLPQDKSEENVLKWDPVKNYSKAVTELHNKGETDDTIKQYKDAVVRLLNIPEFGKETNEISTESTNQVSNVEINDR